MLNLEQLSLDLVNHNAPIIDGDNLKENIINHMTKLNKFILNIRSIISCPNQVNLPFNEDIPHIFRNFKSNQIISCINFFPETNQC